MVSSTVKPSREFSILSCLIRYWSVYPKPHLWTPFNLLYYSWNYSWNRILNVPPAVCPSVSRNTRINCQKWIFCKTNKNFKLLHHKLHSEEVTEGLTTQTLLISNMCFVEAFTLIQKWEISGDVWLNLQYLWTHYNIEMLECVEYVYKDMIVTVKFHLLVFFLTLSVCGNLLPSHWW